MDETTNITYAPHKYPNNRYYDKNGNMINSSNIFNNQQRESNKSGNLKFANHNDAYSAHSNLDDRGLDLENVTIPSKSIFDFNKVETDPIRLNQTVKMLSEALMEKDIKLRSLLKERDIMRQDKSEMQQKMDDLKDKNADLSRSNAQLYKSCNQTLRAKFQFS